MSNINFDKLKSYTDKISHFYGTEDLSIHLYSWVKMLNPLVCVEFGTGLGVTSLWMGSALKENSNGGILHTVDNGADWKGIQETLYLDAESSYNSYGEYISSIFEEYDLNPFISFNLSSIEDFNTNVLPNFDRNSIDILFSDYKHGPVAITKLFAEYLPYMSENSMIFIDSAPTYYPSYSMLKDFIINLNSGKNLKSLISWSKYPDEVKEKISSCRFELFNIYENKSTNQNSTTCIRLSSNDIFPPTHLTIRGI